jgi:probable F420-dependent oxidoreductase
MRLEVVLPAESVAVPPRAIVELAKHAEVLGYDGVWLPDHLLPPQPYGPTYGGVYEPLVTLAFIAAVTDRVRLGTSVLILPLRDPFLLAKQVATVERLAPGRVVLGVGTGWEEQEFAALRVPYVDRGARTDSAIRVIRHLHTVGHGSFEDDHFGFSVGTFAPMPTGSVPILVGGTSPAALRRAATLGDGWHGLGLGPKEFRARAEDLRARAHRPFETGTRVVWTGDDRRVQDAVDEARDFAGAGADHLAVWFGDITGFADRMAEFADAYAGPSSGSSRADHK